jgi:hypothetical protein
VNAPIRNDITLLVVALYDDSRLDDILLGITGVTGARVTILEGLSSAENISQNIPMFAHLIGMTGKKGCKVLLSATTVENPVTLLLELLENAGIDFVRDSLGEIYCIKVGQALTLEEDDLGL